MGFTNKNNRDVRRFREVHSLLKTRRRIADNIATLRVTNLRLRRDFGFDPRERRDGVFFLAVASPPTKRRPTIVRKWSDNGDRSDGLIQRQRLALVFQEHHRTARDLTRETNTLRTQQRSWLACLISVRTIKQSERKLYPQNTPPSFVDRGGREFVLLQEFRAKLVIAAAHHLHVDTRIQSCGRCFFFIRGDAVIDQLAHRRVITDDKPIKLPLVSQNLRERKRIRRRRHTIDRIERTHQRPDTSIDSSLERRQIDLTQRVLGKIYRVVVPTTFRGAIRYEVFCTREDLVCGAVIITLKPTHTRARKRGAEKRIFARAFTDASPTRIACDVDHRREGPTQSHVVRFLCGNRGGAFRECRIPTARLSERNRKDRAITVNHVEAEQHRNLQSRLVHRHTLHLVRTLRAANAECRAEQSFADQLE